MELFSDDEAGLWIANLGARVQSLLGKSELSGYLKNMMSSDVTINMLIKDMNEGNIPSQDLERSLRSLVLPLKAGLTK